jgi:hypothetical protein
MVLCFVEEILIFMNLIVNMTLMAIRWFDGENRSVTGTVLNQDPMRFWHEISSFPDWQNIHPSLPNHSGRFQPVFPPQ